MQMETVSALTFSYCRDHFHARESFAGMAWPSTPSPMKNRRSFGCGFHSTRSRMSSTSNVFEAVAEAKVAAKSM